MKAAVLLLFVGVLALALFLPSGASPSGLRAASHDGGVDCPTGPAPVSDGSVGPAEYGESYFDGTTKILLYLQCDGSTEPWLHVALVSPWAGWTGFLLQATEAQDGAMNEIRVAVTSSGLQVLDAFGNVSAGTSSADASLGGTSDVVNGSAGMAGAARVFEFSIPLRSADAYDSHLQGTGPYSFALEYNAHEAALDVAPTVISEPHSVILEAPPTPGAWTYIEITFMPSSAPVKEPAMLVSLRDAAGYPIPSAQLEIAIRTAFGFYDAGPIFTNEQGVAQVSYAPRDNGTYLIGVAYTGGYGYLASVTWSLFVVGSPSPGGEIGLGLLEGSPLQLRSIEALIVVVVGSVWAAYAYAFFLTWRSMRPSKAGLASRDTQVLSWRAGK